ncbi:VOC family protein [Enterococcus sp. DIV0170]|uniref:VOC family protein n=1 Tax=Enterococcus sp. DIV0170 TaxID=2774642 RepID=UPI003F29D0CF
MVTPYILFNKQCEEAMRYYEEVFSGEKLTIQRYQDYIPEGVEEDVSNYVLHGEMELFGSPFTFADEFSIPFQVGNNVHLTVNPSGVEEAAAMFDALKEAGEVYLPPTKTFYSPFHGSVKDKYGIVWNMIVI